jgi:adenylate kinase family enzyme
MRMIIIGNSGSGKTRLAARLAQLRGISVVHIDDIFWEPGGFDKRRPQEVVWSLIQEAKAKDSWIAEGVFGELAEQFFDRAKCLVWLDIDWPICHTRLLKRGSESKKHLGRTQSEQGLKNLVEWASQYYERTNACSYEGHKKLMVHFPGLKVRLKSEAEVVRMIELARQNPGGDVVIDTSNKA